MNIISFIGNVPFRVPDPRLNPFDGLLIALTSCTGTSAILQMAPLCFSITKASIGGLPLSLLGATAILGYHSIQIVVRRMGIKQSLYSKCVAAGLIIALGVTGASFSGL